MAQTAQGPNFAQPERPRSLTAKGPSFAGPEQRNRPNGARHQRRSAWSFASFGSPRLLAVRAVRQSALWWQFALSGSPRRMPICALWQFAPFGSSRLMAVRALRQFALFVVLVFQFRRRRKLLHQLLLLFRQLFGRDDRHLDDQVTLASIARNALTTDAEPLPR